MKYFKNEANEEEMSIAFQYFSKASENNYKDSALRAKKISLKAKLFK